MTETEKRKSLLRIAVVGLGRAPRNVKLALVFNFLLIATVGALDMFDNVGEEAALARSIALALFMGGALLLGVASVLWTISQQGDNCSWFDLKREAFRMKARKLDETLIAFPVLAFLAGCMVAAGLALYWPLFRTPVATAALTAMAAWFFFWTARMIATTSRFLYTHAREQAEAAERAHSEATESQLAALQAQMNPHFLFNTLNTVASLIRTDPNAAETTVENLAMVLRRTLDRSRRILSTVDDEIDYLAAYLSVAQQRFEHRLQVHWAVDSDARDMLLPTMTLQPLVENSLKHGIGARLEGGALHIGVHTEGSADDERGQRLVIEVADDGPGFPRRYREGTGLANLRERLSTLYGDEGTMTVDRSAPGSRVVVSLPAAAGDVLDSGAESREYAHAIAAAGEDVEA